MKIQFSLALVACFAAAVVGCSGERDAVADKAREAASQAADTARDAADTARDAAGDVRDQARDAAGDVKDQAGDMLGSLRSQWNEQLDGFDERLRGLQESARRLDDEDLNVYVRAIETKLAEAKAAIANLAGGDVDLAAIRETIASRMTELKGLLQAAEDKVKSLTADGR